MLQVSLRFLLKCWSVGVLEAVAAALRQMDTEMLPLVEAKSVQAAAVPHLGCAPKYPSEYP